MLISNALVHATVCWALCVMRGMLLPLGLANETTPRSYPLLDESISWLKNYTESVKERVMSSTYLMGQGEEEWEKERLTVDDPFGSAAFAIWEVEYFLESIQLGETFEAEALTYYQLTSLTALLDIVNFTSLVAKNFYRPIGQNRDCGLYPENMLLSAIAPPLESTLDEIASRLVEIRRSVIDGSYKASVHEEHDIYALRKVCRTFDIETKLETLQKLVSPGCDEISFVLVLVLVRPKFQSSSSSSSRPDEDELPDEVKTMVPIHPKRAMSLSRRLIEATLFSLPIQEKLVEFANQSSMEGGNENGCLHVFIARYTQSTNATLTFKNAVDKYVYLSVIIQGFCYQLLGPMAKEKYLVPARTVVKAIRTGMSQKLDGLKLNDSVPWNCEKPRTTTTESPLPTTSLFIADTTTYPSSTPTTASIELATRDEVRKFVTDELDHADKGFESKAWESRIGIYREMLRNAVINVRNKHNESLSVPWGSVEGIMFLPYGEDDDEQQCLQTFNGSDGDHAKGYRYKGADFFIRFTYNVSAPTLSVMMKEIVKRKDALLDDVFSPKGGNLCKRVTDAGRRFESSAKMKVVGQGGFSAVAAVKCGRQFVWYELGYRYFAAAGVSNQKYVITSQNVGKFNANCGQIMFFP